MPHKRWRIANHRSKANPSISWNFGHGAWCETRSESGGQRGTVGGLESVRSIRATCFGGGALGELGGRRRLCTNGRRSLVGIDTKTNTRGSESSLGSRLDLNPFGCRIPSPFGSSATLRVVEAGRNKSRALQKNTAHSQCLFWQSSRFSEQNLGMAAPWRGPKIV